MYHDGSSLFMVITSQNNSEMVVKIYIFITFFIFSHQPLYGFLIYRFDQILNKNSFVR